MISDRSSSGNPREELWLGHVPHPGPITVAPEVGSRSHWPTWLVWVGG